MLQFAQVAFQHRNLIVQVGHLLALYHLGGGLANEAGIGQLGLRRLQEDGLQDASRAHSELVDRRKYRQGDTANEEGQLFRQARPFIMFASVGSSPDSHPVRQVKTTGHDRKREHPEERP